MEKKFRAWIKNQFYYFDLINLDRKEFTITEWNEAPKQQYTGLKDKNGKEIWEKDILKLDNGQIGIVVMGNQNGCWCLQQKDALLKSPLFNFMEKTICTVREVYFEVIGNIYKGLHSCENKDILKEWTKTTEKQFQPDSKDIKSVKKLDKK